MTEYKPTGLSEEIFSERYTLFPGETWKEASKRVADHAASAENDISKHEWSDKFYDEIVSNRFMPGGRIWYGSGRPRAQLLNCFVLKMPADSREGWGKAISDMLIVSGMGGGVGINFSSVRPRGSKIGGTGGIATGAVSLMNMINGVGDELVAGGARRVALMMDLNITHPDMPEFIDAKLNKNKLTNANVSVVIDKKMNTETFVSKVRNGQNFDLNWGGTARDSVNAKELWEKIVTNAYNSGEPGVLNGDLANRESNIWYHKPLVSTNPCGEIWLEEFGCCDLGALVLPNFVDNLGTFKWEQLDHAIDVGVRLLDNVLTINEYPIPEIRENCNTVRRIGLGITGLHSMLIKMGFKYDSDSAKRFVDELMEHIKIEAYMASIGLAMEKGPFPAFQADEFINSGFMQRAMPIEIREGLIKDWGIRNCALLTIAPTGTTGMVSNVSTGIEPLFSAAYWRRFYRPTSDGSRVLDKTLVIDPLWGTVDPDLLQGAYDIDPEDHFTMQKICQDHIDNATSKTINLAADYPVEALSDLWLEYLPYLKGTTFYRAGSRGEEPLQSIPLAEAKELLGKNAVAEQGSINEQNIMDCVGDTCEISEHLKPKVENKEQIIQFV